MEVHILFVVRQRSLEKRLLPELQQTYAVTTAQLRREALQCLTETVLDLLLVDLPSIRFDSERFLNDAREIDPALTIFLLLGKGVRLDQAPQANGYLRHPFTVRQLLHRLQRTLPARIGEMVKWRDLQLDTDGHFLMWRGQQVALTPKQSALAQAFLEEPDSLLTRAQLMHDVWGTDYLGDTRTLDVHIHWLRKALQKIAAPFVLKTKRSHGYRLICTEEDE